MSKRYTPEEKTIALQILADNFGSVAVTSVQTGIPERTLFTWRRHQRLQKQHKAGLLQQHPTPSPSLPPLETSENTEEAEENTEEVHEFQKLRDQLMQHIFTLSQMISVDPNTAYLKAAAISRLLDRVLKLEAHIPKSKPGHFVIEYYDATTGKTSNVPPWLEPGNEDSYFHRLFNKQKYDPYYDPDNPPEGYTAEELAEFAENYDGWEDLAAAEGIPLPRKPPSDKDLADRSTIANPNTEP